jgi:hypothetical protein
VSARKSGLSAELRKCAILQEHREAIANREERLASVGMT